MIRPLAVLASLVAGPAAADCAAHVFERVRFTACRVDLDTADVRLFLRGEDGTILGSFDRAAAMLPPDERLTIAMNGGMYHDDRSPVGLYVEDGAQEMFLVTQDGPGNFGLLPNGVFCVREAGGAIVMETRAFEAAAPDCRHATQSGPMLVLEGDLHPRFLPDSDSVNIRNGVGVTDGGGTVIFAISDEAVNFHTFARFFRDGLGVDDALYLDGRISRFYADELDRHDRGFPMGPILGVVIDDGAAEG